MARQTNHSFSLIGTDKCIQEMVERYLWQNSVKHIFSHVFIPDDLKPLNVSFPYNSCRHVGFVP